MAKKTKKKSSNHINDEITDERFIAAATRPQFQKAKRGSSHHHHNKSSTSTAKSKSNTNALDDDSGGALISTTSNHDTSGLGVSLTQAIQSDDRFAAALNSDKFGCVPSRDKYGRKVKKKKKKKEEECNNRDDVEESDVESLKGTNKEEEVGKKSKKNKSHNDNNEEDDSDSEGIEQGNNSMEARIAYLNALSRGDISASSSSESDSEEEDSDDDSDDSSTSSTNVRGKSGVFDPNYKSLPGEAQHNSEEEEELTNEPSPHLCILNLNWEHVRAVDVYAMLHSFCPPGTLKHVAVYPSDFGRERMEKERMEGPGFAGLWKKDKKSKKQKSGGENRGEEGEEEDGDSGSDSEQHSNSDDDEDASESNDEDGSEDEEDVLNLAEATSKLYAHFPPQSTVMKNSQLTTQDEEEEGFDIEKLREYEASKLRYYFAIATFSTPQAAEVVYENVDGMEMENSASEIDVRVLPSSQYSSTIEGRELRDNCNALPAKYVPPENVVTTALRQSRVTCSWETGDADRERKLTKYGMGKDAWEALAEGDDIKFYLATSDNSSASESDDDEEEEVNETEATKSKTKKKGSNMRAMLGLAGSDSEEEEENEDESRQILMDDQSISEDSSSGSDSDGSSKDNNKQQSKKKLVSTESESESDEDEAKNKNSTKQVTFTPGKHNLEQKIRSKLQSKQSNINGELLGSDDDGEEKLSPYQKYLEKRKEKRRERRQATRGARKGKNEQEDSDNDNMNQDDDNDGMYGVDAEFGIAQFSDEESNSEVAGGEDDNDGGDGFFLGKKTSSSSKSKNGKAEKQKKMDGKGTGSNDKNASTKEELELLVAGDDDEEHTKDYDMRGLTKLERHANKKLKGKRKRQLETLASNVSGQDFHIDTTDDRFSALLDGGDDRFGIDRTNPAYKETGAMKELLQEQSKRRKKKRNSKEMNVKSNNTKKNDGIAEHRNENSWKESSSGAMALSSLVQSLQQKVSSKGSSRKKNH